MKNLNFTVRRVRVAESNGLCPRRLRPMVRQIRPIEHARISGLTASHKSVGAILDRPLSHEPASMPESCTCDQADISENLKVGCIQNVHLYQCFSLGL